MLIEKYGNIFTVHRLDKETSGIILFAKDEATHKFFSKQFEERDSRKILPGLGTWFDCLKNRQLLMRHHGTSCF